MADNEQIEFLLRLADVHWRDYSERRSIEWKTNFGLWLALGTFSAFMFQHTTNLPVWVRVVISALLSITFIVYTCIWKREIRDRNSADKAAAEHYWKQVVVKTEIDSAAIREVPKIMGWPRTHISQVIITLLFVLLAIMATWVDYGRLRAQELDKETTIVVRETG